MEDRKIYDVAVLGAGPAGTTAALRLLQLNYRVIIIEKLPFPRFNIGESLSPGVKEILKYIGAEDIAKEVYNKSSLLSSILWELNQKPIEIPAEQNHHQIVNRASFDHDLLKLCIKKGADILQPFSAGKISVKDDICEIHCSSAKTAQKLVSAHFIFDARGKHGVSNHEKYYIAPPSFAKSATLRNDHFQPQSFLEAHEKFWLWGTTLANNSIRFIFFSDPAKNSLQTPSSKLLSQSYFGQQLTNHESIFEKSFLSFPFWNTNAINSHCFRLGEAAFALDPLSSSGVEKAMRYSLQAVIAFNSWYRNGDKDLAQNYLKEKLLETASNHAIMNQIFYQKSFVSTEHSFWKKRRNLYFDNRWENREEDDEYQKYLNIARRRMQIDSERTEYLMDKDVLQGKFTISKDIKYVKKSCVIADCLEEKLVISSITIKREIGFINGIEIVPILEILPKVFYLSDLPLFWKDKVRPNLVQGILTILLQNNVLIPIQKN